MEVSLPGEEERPQIFEYYLSKITSHSPVSLEDDFFDNEAFRKELSHAAKGRSGSDIENICLNVAGEASIYSNNIISKSML